MDSDTELVIFTIKEAFKIQRMFDRCVLTHTDNEILNGCKKCRLIRVKSNDRVRRYRLKLKERLSD